MRTFSRSITLPTVTGCCPETPRPGEDVRQNGSMARLVGKGEKLTYR